MITRDVVNRITAMMPMLEPALFLSRQPAGSDTFKSYKLQKVRPRKIDKKDVAMNPALLSACGKVFELYSNYLDAAGAPPPKKDDKLTDNAGVTWVMVMVDVAMNSTVYNCYSRVEV